MESDEFPESGRIDFLAGDVEVDLSPEELFTHNLVKMAIGSGRDRKLMGWKFRRQCPVDSYVLDFYCHDLRLAAELDGNVHSETRQAAHDENRDAYLEALTVLRFPNDAVLTDLASVLEQIANVAEALTSFPQESAELQ